MGTMSEAIDYKSPEQVREAEFDFRSDLWQLVGGIFRMIIYRAFVCMKCFLVNLPSSTVNVK